MELRHLHGLVFFLLLQPAFGYNTWEEYWAAYTEEVYYPQLFPYDSSYGDNEVSSGDGSDSAITFTIPYAGKHFKGAYVSVFGHVEMSQDSPASYTYKDLETSWPNMKYPNDTDPPFISPYIADWNLRGPTDDGRLYWRRLDPTETEDADEQEIDRNLLEIMSQEARQHVVGAEGFSALYGLLVTWHNMQYGGCVADTCARNTVQMALITDERSCHVIYNYYDVNWVGGIDQRCDPETGMTGDGSYANCVPAQVGFNAGWAQHFTALPDSKTDEIVNIDDKGATGTRGRYIYQVERTTPMRGGCSNETFVDREMWPLEIHPHSISMYGGDVVYFSGPCLLPEHDIVCRFENKEVMGHRVDEGQSKGMCVAPVLWTAGWKRLCISTDGGTNFDDWCTDIHIVPKYYMWPKIALHELEQWYSRTPDADLNLEWNPEVLVYRHERCGESTLCNHTTAGDLKVNIALIGYTETVSSNGSRTPHMHNLLTFETGVENSGMYSFIPAEHECELDSAWIYKPPIGLIEISVTDDGEENPRRIYSEPVPLGWCFDWPLSLEHGSDWPTALCTQWFVEENTNYPWSDEITPCPMTHIQAVHDVGHFMVPPPDCEPGRPCPMQPRPDPYISCANAVLPGSHATGTASSCCYPPTPHGSLSYGLDHPMGSAAHKASPNANIDLNGHHVVPLLSHMTRDRQPYLWCCNWTNNKDLCTEHYMAVRPTLDASAYSTPQYAVAYGDPHFLTFDGSNYTFNGHGEYWLLQVLLESSQGMDSFNLQARFVQPEPGPYGAVNGTVITAIAMQESYGDDIRIPKIQIQLADATSRTQLQVLYNGQEIDLTPIGYRYQERFYTDITRKLTIINNNRMDDNSQSNVTVMFDTGVVVQAANRGGYMHVVVVAPPMFWGETRGLFGLWNDDPSDDLRSESGQTISAEETLDHIHSQFGQTWATEPSQSRFYYYGSSSWNYYSKPGFKPNFEEPQGSVGNVTEAEVTEFCGDEFMCRYDYKTTMQKEVANNTVMTQMWALEAKHYVEPVLSCPYLEVPHSEREVDSYLVGGQMTFTRCVEGYTLRGHNEYECVQVSDTQAEWTPDPNVHCKDNDEIAQENMRMAVAIVVPIVLIAIIVAVVGGLLFYRHRKKKTTGGPEDKSKKSSNEKENKKKETKSSKSSTTRADRELQFENMAASAERSHSLASMNVSFGSIVLTQDLQTARPPRPSSTHAQPYSYQHPPSHNVTSPAQFGGSQTSLDGARGYSLSPQGPAFSNRSYDPGDQPVAMPMRTPSQQSLSNQQQSNTPGHADMPGAARPTLASMAAAYQSNQSQQEIPEPPYQSPQGYHGNQPTKQPANVTPTPQQGIHQQQGYQQPSQRYPLPQGGYLDNQPGERQGAANLAMADEDSDSSYEPRADDVHRSMASLGGKDTIV